MAFENLSIRVSAATESAERGLARVGDELTDMTAAAIGANAATTATSQSLDEAGDAAGRSATQMGAFALAAKATHSPLLTLNALSTTTIATLSTLALAAAGLATVLGAGIFAAAAVGASTLKEEFKAIRDELVAAIRPLAEDFLPLLKDAIRALPELARRIVAAIGPTEEFRDSFRKIGRAAMDVIPALVEGLVGFGRLALPVIETALPLLRGLAVVFRAVGSAAGVLGQALNALPISSLTVALGALYVATLPISGPITALTAAVAALGIAWKENWGNIRGVTRAVVDFVMTGIKTLQRGLRTLEIAANGALAFIEGAFRTTLAVIKGIVGQIEAAVKTAKDLTTSNKQEFRSLVTAPLKEGAVSTTTPEAATTQSDRAVNPTTIRIGQIVASSRAGGQRAAREIRSGVNIPDSNR